MNEFLKAFFVPKTITNVILFLVAAFTLVGFYVHHLYQSNENATMAELLVVGVCLSVFWIFTCFFFDDFDKNPPHPWL